ncbi:hypothetical protein BA6E_124251 [Bacteroidales bacterium 6E]|nr:hypothetical protein BA6E_124251 [Bacteroidales bacterium 6E]
MERTELLIYLLIFVAVVYLVVKYWRTGKEE